MIVIGDIHAKYKEPYLSATYNFFDWLLDNYRDENIIQVGDLFDTASPHAEVEYRIADYITQFRSFHILSGNHDQNRRVSNTLLPLQVHDKVFVYTEKTEVTIEGHSILMLPYVENKSYEEIKWEGQYCFLHMTDLQNQFASEGIDTSKIKATKIWGHTHTYSAYDDNIIIGVPTKTRHGESDNKVIEITENGNINYIDHPSYFEFETLAYGKFPENKNNILNIVEAPSRQAVFETYKDYYIREEGIEVLRTESDKKSLTLEEIKKTFDGQNLLIPFTKYNVGAQLKKEVYDDCVSRLQKLNN